jgi:hypothetical protein
MKMIALSIGLLALMATSPQPASAAPDTGPEVDNIVFENSSAPAAEYIAIQALDEVGNNIISDCARIYGRETVPDPSDHTVSNHYVLNPVLKMMTVSSSALAAVEPERPCNSAIMNGYSTLDLDLSKNSTGLPLVGYAQHSHQMVWVLERPAWTMRYLRC